MKILIVNTFDKQGGAARAAYRLHLSLLENGVESQMLVQLKSSNDYTVLCPTTKIKKLLNRIKPTLDQFPVNKYKDKIQTLFSPNWLPSRGIVKIINELNPDIVHLHWINFGMIRIEDIAKINAPIVWSLHDNWAFTGGCHIMWTCEKYKTGCGLCPNLLSKKEKDLSYRIFKRKLKTYSKIDNITIIGLSKWMAKCAKESYLFREKTIINLPNPIDTQKFKPISKKYSRDLWNLPHDKTLILFGALSAASDINKGFNELKKSLQLVKESNIELVVFGVDTPKKSQFVFKTNYLGELNDDISLATIYNACDITVVPSLQENLSNIIMESLSCGKPVVAFDIGGNSDMIEHKKTGYLAKPFESEDLANGIEWIIKNNEQKELSINAREKVIKEFDFKIVSDKYIDLYKTILNHNSSFA
jgi:glycosyltransferase involved in cell wall biosynthesis